MMDDCCGHVYSIFSGKYILVKFEGEKEADKMALITYVQCTAKATETEIIGQVLTKFGEASDLIVHNCAMHSYKARGLLKDI